jgi:hypothetical protein
MVGHSSFELRGAPPAATLPFIRANGVGNAGNEGLTWNLPEGYASSLKELEMYAVRVSTNVQGYMASS